MKEHELQAQAFLDEFKGDDGVKGNPFSEQLELNLQAGLSEIFLKMNKMESAMVTFIKRCEDGSIRSRRTYSQFKEILEK